MKLKNITCHSLLPHHPGNFTENKHMFHFFIYLCVQKMITFFSKIITFFDLEMFYGFDIKQDPEFCSCTKLTANLLFFLLFPQQSQIPEMRDFNIIRGHQGDGSPQKATVFKKPFHHVQVK